MFRQTLALINQFSYGKSLKRGDSKEAGRQSKTGQKVKFLEALNDNNRGEDISDQRLIPRRYGLHQVGAPKPFPGLTGMLTWKKGG